MHSQPQATFRELFAIQQQHLAEWRKILKPKAYEELVQRITAKTYLPPEHLLDKQVDFNRGADSVIPRGDDISTIVLTLRYERDSWD